MALVQKGFTHLEASQMFKDISNKKAKHTWLIKLLELPKLNEKHLKAISNISDLRNNFVHYKWKALSDEADERQRKNYIKSLENINKTIVYLKNYIRRNVTKISYGKSKKILNQV